ncbi:MAG: methyltransferase domain-containing protein [Calditrichaeota bacterium]|nr:methyltransferase domain-containing protein [Calditrichota bacterium]
MKSKPEKIRYNRIAPIYDWLEWFPETLAFRKWRQRLFQYLTGKRVLEVGLGTGKNIPYYPPDVQLVGIDISRRMLSRAREKAMANFQPVGLLTMDAQRLAFPDQTFDHTISTFVFCSVYEPVEGLRELYRVLKPGGTALFLEHVRPESPLPGKVFDMLNPLIVRMMGANINRRTVENIRKAGFEIEKEWNLWKDIVKFVVARKPETERKSHG